MRTTVDLPDPLYRALKARAATEGRSVKDLMSTLLERALAQHGQPTLPRTRSQPPTLATGVRLPLASPSNATLFELLDDEPR